MDGQLQEHLLARSNAMAAGARGRPRHVSIDGHAIKDMLKLARCAGVWPAISIVGLALVEGLAVSKAGSQLSQFYQIFLDRDARRFVPTLAVCVLAYGSVCLARTASYFIGAMLVIRWRRRITLSLQAHYFHSNVYHKLNKLAATDSAAIDAEAGHHATMTQLRAQQSTMQRPDNPDQRMTDDVSQFCTSLDRLCQHCAKAPFNLAWFSYMAYTVFHSAVPLLLALVFFCGCALLHRAAAAAIASAVYDLAKAEGDFRSAHMRVRDAAAHIAAWNGGGVEEHCLASSLEHTLAAQFTAACASTAQQLIMLVGDYGSVLVNYAVLGFAIFEGAFFADSSSHGSDATRISLATFYLIMVANAMTTFLDASKALGELAGHAARICDFARAMAHTVAGSSAAAAGSQGSSLGAQSLQQQSKPTSQLTSRHAGVNLLYPVADSASLAPSAFVGAYVLLATPRPAQHSAVQRGWLGAHGAQELQPVWQTASAVTSAFGMVMPDELRDQTVTLLRPVTAWLPGGCALELSLHRVEGGQLRDVVSNVFPGLPLAGAVTAICTYQAANPAAMRHRQTAEAELSQRLACLQSFEGVLRDHVTAHGFWCDTVDPRTGMAMHGAASARYSEAVGAQVFCGYGVATHGLISAVVHPVHGVHTYPVTIFTTAPLVNVHSAIGAACSVDPAQLHAQSVTGAQAPDAPVLAVRDICVAARHTYDAAEHGGARAAAVSQLPCIVAGASFDLARGQRIVVCGLPGAGKSTLLHALRGLVPLQSGGLEWAHGARAMHMPQEAVLAPGATLAAQLMYPERGECDAAEAQQLLDTVGLAHLWWRCDGAQPQHDGPDPGTGEARDGASALASLSAGELQCLSLARVLRAKPDVALLDEAFAAVPAETEAALLAQLAAAGVAVLMVSHRQESMHGADAVLTLHADLPDGWQLERLK